MNSNTLSNLRRDIPIKEKLRGHDFEFRSTWGLFSPKKIDEGSRLLLDQIEINPTDISLDVGCGYGAIGIPVARLSYSGSVHMVDKDFVAIEYAKKNVKINKIQNCAIYLSNAFSNVPKIKFDNIISNLPAKVGRELLYLIIYDAKRYLKKNGKCYVVTISGLKQYIKNNFKEVFGNYRKLKQGKSHTVAVAVKE